VNLLADAEENLYLVGLATTSAGADVVDVFTVDLSRAPQRLLRKLLSKPMTLAANSHFRYAGGLWIDGSRLAVLASPRTLDRSTRISLAR
jgi:hypothetical protein